MAYKGNRPLFGLHPCKNAAGTAPKIRHFHVDSAYATAIGEGCIVIKAADGIELAVAGSVTAPYVVGVAAASLSASTGGSIPVYCDPEQEYFIVPDGTMTTTVQKEMVGQFAKVLTNTANSTIGGSNAKVDISTVVGTYSATGLQVQILGTADLVGDTYASTQSSTGEGGQIFVRLPGYHQITNSSSLDRPS